MVIFKITNSVFLLTPFLLLTNHKSQQKNNSNLYPILVAGVMMLMAPKHSGSICKIELAKNVEQL